MLAARESSRSSAMKSAGAIDAVAIGKNSAVGLVAVVVETNIVVMPIVSPVSPAPAKTAKEADPKGEAKRNSRTIKEQARIPIPAGPNPDGFSIDEPWVILGNVHHLRVGGLDHNGLPLLAHLFLRCAF